MTLPPGSIAHYQFALQQGDASELIPAKIEQMLERSNSGGLRNTYLWQDAEWTRNEAQHAVHDRVQSATGRFGDSHAHPILWGVPVSVKDCFDLAGSPTTCGTRFYRDLNGIAAEDSWLVARLRSSGAIVTGKTHLHPLAYGITGENPDFGDCLQPTDPGALTGGSSSGAAASVLEGSAMAAIGTDTGGSIRVPAALCGLAGYRATLGIGDWRGAAHLAPSFDTMGWLFRSFADGKLLAQTLDFHLGRKPVTSISELLQRKQLIDHPRRFAIVGDAFLHDCEPGILASLRQSQAELEALGMTAHLIDVSWWSDSMEIFAPIQASEAAAIHRGHYAEFEPSIAQRLAWGASLSETEIASLRRRHEHFKARMDALLAEHEFLLLPAAPVARLAAGADHSQTRTRLLRYTTPVSLSGMPAVTVPCFAQGRPAGGMQLVAARGDDDRLLELAAKIEAQRAVLVSGNKHPSPTQ
jgi:aspartyl-tRNA(Asn)/glutamyl-tRNA(Gln) amidotransferase subunit A